VTHRINKDRKDNNLLFHIMLEREEQKGNSGARPERIAYWGWHSSPFSCLAWQVKSPKVSEV
jgi:hypothetical protein